MDYLDELLSIKSFREQQAESTLQVARVVLSDANRGEQKSEQTLSEFRNFARAREDAGYREILSRAVKVQDIFRLHEDIAILRATEAQHESELQKARLAREAAQQKHQAADLAAREARTSREKFTELVEQHHIGLAQQAERSEELEFEELAGIVREREQWSEEPDV
jgi:type III secretion protein O